MLICCHQSKCKGPGRLCCCFVSPRASWAQSRNHHRMPGGFQWTFPSVSVHLQTRCWLAGPHPSGRLLWLPQSSVFEKHRGSKWLYNRASVFLPGRRAALEKKEANLFQGSPCVPGHVEEATPREAILISHQWTVVTSVWVLRVN